MRRTTRSAARFRANIQGSYADLERKVTMLRNGIVFKLYAWVIEGTRVDSGRMQSGWQIAVHVAGNYVPAKGQEHYSPSPPQEFIADLEGATLGAKVLIFNNVEYVVFWEFGTDRHGGDHMVKLAIQRLLAA